MPRSVSAAATMGCHTGAPSTVVTVFMKFKSDIPDATSSGLTISFAVAAGAGLAVVLLASLVPALRAAGIQPLEAMRSE